VSRAGRVAAYALGTGALVLTPATAALADLKAGLARCAAIVASGPRLDCYDALAERPPATTAAGTTTPPAVAPPVVAPTAPAAPARADDPAAFGLTNAQLHVAPAGPESIQAVVARVNVDRQGTVSVRLDNGQTWVLVDPDPRLNAGDVVTIKRAALGSFLMTMPSRRSARVRRVE
jgi:hypothetical protein